MRGKAALIIGLATGYVLGTRDGRARYQQIKTQANRFISDPRVQQKASQATDLAKEKAPLVKDKLADVTDKATSKATSRATSKVSGSSSGGSDLPEQTTTSAPDLSYSPSDPLDTELDTDLDSTDLHSTDLDSTGSAGGSGSAGTPAQDTDVVGDTDDTGDTADSGQTEDDDVVVLTPPTPSPLAPGPTQTDSSGPSTGGSNG